MSLPAGSDGVRIASLWRSSPQDGVLGCRERSGRRSRGDRGDRPPLRLPPRARALRMGLGLACGQRGSRWQTTQTSRWGRYHLHRLSPGMLSLISLGCAYLVNSSDYNLVCWRTCYTAALHSAPHAPPPARACGWSYARESSRGLDRRSLERDCPFRFGRPRGAAWGHRRVTGSEARSRTAPLARSACCRGPARRASVTGGTPSQ